MLSYKCPSCGKIFKLSERPKFCPYCAAEGVTAKGETKAKDTAMQLIEEHDRLMKELLDKFNEYAQIYAKVECIRSTLRTYKSRGIISEKEMPDFTKPKLIDYVKKQRKTE